MTEIEHHQMMPGDLLEYRCVRFGVVWQWRVLGIYLGALRQEGLIEVTPVSRAPGTASGGEPIERTLVPEPMTRGLSVIRPGLPQRAEDASGTH